MAAWTVAARQAANLSRFPASKSASLTKQGGLLIQRRGLAGGGDHHGPPKVNFWQDPMSPSKWKEEHYLESFTHFGRFLSYLCQGWPVLDRLVKFVIVSLTGWGLAFYGGYKLATRGKKEKKE
ncbi:putative PAP-specific phosphatase HAL2-like [Capsicum annuum]|nr:putative PAP-specific phosphatase HAL2-like [Capsicum annuum]